MRPSTGLLLLAAALNFFSSTPLHAASITIYDNFSDAPGDPGYPYADPIYAYSVSWQYDWNWPGWGTFAYGAQQAMPFTVAMGQDLYLESVSMAMYKWPSNFQFNQYNSLGAQHDNLKIQIVGSSGSLPNVGNVIETLSVNPAIAEDNTTFLSLTSSLHPLLLQGQTYWIVARGTSFSTTDDSTDMYYGWIQNKTGATWRYTINQWNPSWNAGNGGWQGFFSQTRDYTAPTLRVTGTITLPSDVPEPSYAGVLLIGGIAVFVARYRFVARDPARSLKGSPTK